MTTLSEVVTLQKIEQLQTIRFGGSISKVARKDLADRLLVEDVSELDGDLMLRRVSEDSFRLTGEITAKVHQRCVVTDQPTSELLVSNFARDLIVGEDPDAGELLEIVELSEGEDPDYLPNGQLTLIELVADSLALEVNPYPRAQEDGDTSLALDLPEGVELNAPPQKAPNPFSALAALKK